MKPNSKLYSSSAWITMLIEFIASLGLFMFRSEINGTLIIGIEILNPQIPGVKVEIFYPRRRRFASLRPKILIIILPEAIALHRQVDSP